NWMELSCSSLRPFQRRQHCDEIIREAARVVIKQLGHAFEVLRVYDQSGMMFLFRAVSDLWVVISGRVRIFLFRQRKNNPRMFFARLESRPMRSVDRDFQLRPFAPEVYS